jgi:Phosphotransferase enzyme family
LGELPIETMSAGESVGPTGFDPAVVLPAVGARMVAVGGDRPSLLGAAGAQVPVGAGLQTGSSVAVATARRVEEALASGADTLLLEGRDVRRRLARAGLAVARYLPLPDPSSLELLLPLEQPVAVRYALGRWRPSSALPGAGALERYAKVARDALVGRLPRSLAVPRGRQLVTLATRRPTAPEAVRAASRLVGRPVAAWLPTFTGTHTDSRSVLQLFPAGGREPAWVLKLGRIRGRERQFANEEAVLGWVERSGGAVAAHAPRFVGRMEVAGRPASIETAAVGTGLDRLLAGPASRRRKLEVLESIAGWLDQLARETLAPPSALEPERERIAEQVLPYWRELGVTADLVRTLPAVSAVFVHGDMWEQNIVVGDNGFTAVDWELARPQGFPLWDLVRFASMSLGLLDGALGVEQRARHFIELWSGSAPSSPILFRWLLRAARGAGVPLEAVPAIVTLRWLDDPGRGRFEPPPSPARLLDRLPWLWLMEPGLGPGWQAWRIAQGVGTP